MLKDDLQKLDFTANESAIYLCLLHGDTLRAGEVIKETGLQRSVVYACLEQLAQRGLILKTTERGVATYRTADPGALASEAQQRAFLAEKVADELRRKRNTPEREASVYEGDDIIQRISDKNLAAPADSAVYFLGPSKFGIQASLERYWQRYHGKRIAAGISCKILYDHDTDPQILEDRNKLGLCEARYLPFETRVPMWFNICNDTVGMIIPAEQPPLAFLVRSAKTADALRAYFDYLWKQATELSGP
jgi:sugar-specific transcriptional regulator TrmB